MQTLLYLIDNRGARNPQGSIQALRIFQVFHNLPGFWVHLQIMDCQSRLRCSMEDGKKRWNSLFSPMSDQLKKVDVSRGATN